MALSEPADVNDGDTITGTLWNALKSLLFDAIGGQAFTEQNFVTDDESVTSSLDALDQEVKDLSDGTTDVALTNFQESQYAADAQANDTYVVTLSPVPSAYFNGMVVNFKANTVNTGACTLNVNALGAKSIKKHHDQDPANGDIEAAQIVTVIYDGTNFQMQSQVGQVNIGFPATAVPSADPNTLDDYEEGTWPATFGAATSGTITVNTSYDLMSYTKIGRAVTLCGNAVVASVSSPVGELTMGTLPFANQTGAEDSGMVAVALFCQALEATGTTAMQGRINNGDTKIAIYHFAAGVSANAAADVKASSQFAVNATYFT